VLKWRVFPFIANRFCDGFVLICRMIRTFSGESQLAFIIVK